MFARLTTAKCDPDRLEEMVAMIEEIRPRVRAIPGIIDVYSVWRGDGHCLVTSIYESQGAAEAALEQVQQVWASMAHLLVVPPKPQSYEHVAHITA